MRPLHHAALVTVGSQEVRRTRLFAALKMDREWRYEQDAEDVQRRKDEARRLRNQLVWLDRL